MSRFPHFASLAVLIACSVSCIPAYGQNSPGVRVRTTPLSFEQFIARQRQLQQDLANQRVMLQNTRARLTRWNSSDQQAFQNAFGTTDIATRAQVQMNLDNQLALNARMTASNFQETDVIQPNRYAYVYSNDPSTIYLDDLYSTFPATGPNSRAGALVHEMSHFDNVAGTEDYAYGTRDAAALARSYEQGTSSDQQPAHNADNVRFFAEGAFDVPAPSPAPSPVSTPAPQNRPEPIPQDLLQNGPSAPGRQPQSGMTQEQFRAEVARQMQQFQAAEEFNRQNPLNIPVPQENQTPPIGDVPPAGVRPRVTYNDYAPRNGYDAQGNRPDSSRRRYDENGNYAAPPQRPYSTAIDSSSPADFWQSPAPQAQAAPQRQNRVYNGYDNTSRPIGNGRSNIAQQAAAMQQWSNNQIAAMNARRSAPPTQSSGSNSSVATPAAGDSSSSSPSSTSADSYTPNSASPRATGFGYDESARRGSQIVYDDNVPRGSSTSVLEEAPQRPISSPVYDHRPGQSGIVDPGSVSSDPPAIAPRAAGQSAPTAALRW